MKNKKNILIISILIVVALLAVIIITKEKHLIKLEYNEIIEKIENKENFVLCLSATECVHCQSYKPKLKKIAKEYDIKIYYSDIDTFTDEEYENIKTKLSFDGSTPITIFFKDGEEKTTATRIEGNTQSEKIIAKLKKNGFITE